MNAVSAGVVDTDALQYFPNREELLALFAQRTPAGPTLTPEDVAGAVYLLCLPEAGMVNGHTLFVDGGFAISGEVRRDRRLGTRGQDGDRHGGSRGIGRAIVDASRRTARKWCSSTAERGGRGRRGGSGPGRGPEIAAEQVDVTDAAACTAAVEHTVERCGSIDVLVNNAGVIRDHLLALLEVEDVKAVLDTNVGGVFNVTRAVVPHMIARRAGKSST